MKKHLVDDYHITIINENAITNFFQVIYKKYGLELSPDNNLVNYTSTNSSAGSNCPQPEKLREVMKDCESYCRIYNINMNNLAAEALNGHYRTKPVFADLLLQQYLS